MCCKYIYISISNSTMPVYDEYTTDMTSIQTEYDPNMLNGHGKFN